MDKVMELGKVIGFSIPLEEKVFKYENYLATKCPDDDLKFVPGRKTIMVIPQESETLVWAGKDPNSEQKKNTIYYSFSLDELFFVREGAKLKLLMPSVQE